MSPTQGEKPAGLILHSREDEVIPFRHGEALYAAASEPKEFAEIHGSHNRGFLDSQPLYEAALDSFLSKYLGKKKKEGSALDIWVG